MQVFSGIHAEEIAVVAADDARRIIGSVHKRDVMHAYNQEVLRRDLAGSVSDQVLVASKGQQVALGGGYVLQEIQPPARFFGKTIREINLGAEKGVRIVLLRKRRPDGDKPAIRVPTANDTIEEGDRLVVSGTRPELDSIDQI
jgi:K+/H+ antiporter YhaU regulatory subunit KhtT